MRPTLELPAKNLSHVFKFGKGYHYAHMAVITAISKANPRGFAGPRDPVLMAAWQAAPGAGLI